MTTYLAHSFVPHHEHGIEICFSNDCCDIQNTCSHSQSDHGSSSEMHTCLVKAQSVVQSKENKCSCGTDSMHAHDFIIPFYLLSLVQLESESDTKHTYNVYSDTYVSTYILQDNGLRGPPSVV